MFGSGQETGPSSFFLLKKKINKNVDENKRFCTIRIKRRISGNPGPPPFLAPGELAFNEVDENFYYQTNSDISSLSLSAESLSGSNTF